MDLIKPAADALGDPSKFASHADYLFALEHQSMLTTIDNLMTFPCVRILAERGKLQLHAAYFAVSTGLLTVYDDAAKTFVNVAADEHARLFAQPRF
jgi:carbonic anhydrase